MARIVLGVGGGIAAYKACELVRLLTEAGHQVRVVPTHSALRFVGAATWAALSGQPATTDLFDAVEDVPHVRIGQEADLVVVAPATANLLAKAAHGLADDLLTNVLLTATCPVVMAPAMHTEMWQHPATVENVATLRRRGVTVVEPAVGRLTGADSGPGRLPDPSELAGLCAGALVHGSALDLAGRHVVVSAGGTREPIDPVRFVGNRSSGRQGYALAAAAVSRGARVTVVSANVELAGPAGAEVVRVETAEQLRAAVVAAATDADAVVMAAAVADFRPSRVAEHKMKKGPPEKVAPLTVTLEPTADVLRTLVLDRRPGQVIVGFAAETGDERGSWLEHGRAKLADKGCDLLVVNDVGDGRVFGQSESAAVILTKDGHQVEAPHGPKLALAHLLWDQVVQRL